MRGLITGATGFVGSNLARRLVRLGWKVNVLVRDKNKLGRLSGVDGLVIYAGDLADQKVIGKATKGVDVIFNCAAALNYHKPTEDQFRRTNIDGLKNVLDAVRGSRARLVHLSTVGIYGPTDSSGADEESFRNPQDTYARTKVKGEELIEDYKKRHRIKVVIIRPTIAYGPGDTRPGLLDLFRFIKKGLFIPIGKGENYFHTVYIDNLVDAIILAATKKAVVGKDFIIGDGDAPKMKELYGLVYRICGRRMSALYLPIPLSFVIGKSSDLLSGVGLPNILGSQRVKFLTENKRYRIDKAKKVLGYRSKIDLKEGLKITHSWYKDNGYL